MKKQVLFHNTVLYYETEFVLTIKIVLNLMCG